MAKLSCKCGHETSGDDKYLVEGQMWTHAMEHHLDQLKDLTGEQFAEWLRNKDKELAKS